MSSNRKNNEPELKLTEEQTFKIIELYHEETSLWNVGSEETYMNKDCPQSPFLCFATQTIIYIQVNGGKVRTYVLSAYCVNGKAYVLF